MRILVCVKQVPETTDIPLDERDFTIKRDRAPLMINPNDCAALEHAMLLRESHGAWVTVMTMGRPRAVSMLRETAARGADELVLITDTAFAGSDSLATARILAAAARSLGGFDLLLLGRRAIDGETGHLGPQLSVLLGMECATNVTEIHSAEHGAVRCTRLLEGARMSLELPLPAILTMCGSKSALRPPSISGLKRAASMPVQTLTNEDLQLPPDHIGLNGSPTRVRQVIRNGIKTRKCQVYDDVQAGALAMLEAVRSAIRPRESREDSSLTARKPHLDGKIWAFAWEEDPLSVRTAEELVTAIRSMGAAPYVLCVGSNECAERMLEAGARHVYLFCSERILSETGCALIVAGHARRYSPEVILFPATIRGRSIAPQCAAMLSTGLTADCTDLLLDENGTLTQVRPAFGGSLFAHIECARFRPQLASVRPGVYPSIPMRESGGTVERIFAESIHNHVRGSVLTAMESVSLGDSELVIAGGRGVGSQDGFGLLEKLASALEGSIAASRGAVDAGFAEYARQVGQTGITLRPRIYAAFGISGAVQHLAGMKDSDVIVAVNTNRKAQIFSYADIGIVATWDRAACSLMDALPSIRR